MMRRSIGVLAVLLLACSTGPTFALDIQNFKFGMVCHLGPDQELAEVNLPAQWICFETETIYITGQGSCTFDRENLHCTWYGYEFDYSGAVEGTEILCRMTSSLPGNVGTPEGLDQIGVTVAEWSYSLPPGDGHYYNPQYTVFGLPSESETVNSFLAVCTYDGEELYRFEYTTVHPALTEKIVAESIRNVRSSVENP